MLSSRNEHGLSPSQIRNCVEAWIALGGHSACELDTSIADQSGSRTAYHEDRNVVVLGADVYPARWTTMGHSARSRMSVLACLAHELAHAQRFNKGYSRPFDRMSYLKKKLRRAWMLPSSCFWMHRIGAILWKTRTIRPRRG